MIRKEKLLPETRVTTTRQQLQRCKSVQLLVIRETLLVLGVLLLLAGQVATAMTLSTSSSSPPLRRILCFGDSLTAGTCSTTLELYPYRMALEEGLTTATNNNKNNIIMVRHMGLPGWTAQSMVENLDDGTRGLRGILQRQQKSASPISLVILLAGTNDLGYYEEHEILKNLQVLHQACWEAGVPKTLAIGIPSSAYQDVDVTAREKAQAINQGLQHLSRKYPQQLEYMEFPFGFDKGGLYWDPDGLHCSKEGYHRLGESLVEPVSRILQSLHADERPNTTS